MNKNEFPLPKKLVSNVDERGEIPEGRDEEIVHNKKHLKNAEDAKKFLISKRLKNLAAARIEEIKKSLSKKE